MTLALHPMVIDRTDFKRTLLLPWGQIGVMIVENGFGLYARNSRNH